MSTGIAIVWPAWFLGSTDPQLHATALFLGDTETTAFKRSTIEYVLRWEGLDPGPCRVTGPDLFGKEKNVPVLTIEHPDLQGEHEWLTRRLAAYGVVSPSEFGFNPHVTIAKEAAKPYFPHFIQLERPVLWWGDDRPIHSKHQLAAVS
jgi:2'-5' RNA ligase